MTGKDKMPVLWCVWNTKIDELFWSHPRLSGGKAACENYISASLIPEWLEVRPLYLESISKELEAEKSDCLEQSRLLGMGAERELALIAKLELAERKIAQLEHDKLCAKENAELK